MDWSHVDYLWIIVMFLSAVWRNLHRKHAQIKHRSQRKQFKTALILWCFYQLFGHSFQILTAPIDCRGSTGEQVMQCYISPDLFWWKIQTPLHLRWPGGEYFQQTFIFEWTISLRMVALRSKSITLVTCSPQWNGLIVCFGRAAPSEESVLWRQHMTWIWTNGNIDDDITF